MDEEKIPSYRDRITAGVHAHIYLSFIKGRGYILQLGDENCSLTIIGIVVRPN